jgi:hypothetical protein
MATEQDKPAITPETKVGDLLKHYPELEEVLVGTSPAYKALKNPVLRRTVAKIANLRQVAKVGNVPLGRLIGELRAAAGQTPAAEALDADTSTEARPPWAQPQAVSIRFDARPLIEGGGHPMERVMTDLGELGKGAIYELTTPFVPAPLIDLAKQKGFEAVSSWEGPGVVQTHFRRP